MTDNTTITEAGAEALVLCVEAARHTLGLMIETLLTDDDAAALSAHAETGSSILMEVELAHLPAVRLLIKNRAGEVVELSKIQAAVIQ